VNCRLLDRILWTARRPQSQLRLLLGFKPSLVMSSLKDVVQHLVAGAMIVLDESPPILAE
jgi:hypothetical protein